MNRIGVQQMVFAGSNGIDKRDPVHVEAVGSMEIAVPPGLLFHIQHHIGERLGFTKRDCLVMIQR